MNPRVLLIEDEAGLRLTLSDRLVSEGYRVDTACDGEAGLERAANGHYDLIVLDVMLPDIEGFEVCRQLRSEGIATPVLFLTARDSTADKLTGLAEGDDYVTKPFSPDELVARVRAVLRRSPPDGAGAAERIVFRDLVMDTGTHEVWRGDHPIELTATEFNLLHYLMLHSRQVLSKAQILAAVWEDNFTGDSNIVEIYISYLRKKMDCYDPPLIHTIRRVGYSLREPTR
jgi:two-component system OmpR family response regulator